MGDEKQGEEIIVKLLDIIAGNEASVKISLNGVAFNVGKNKVKMEGDVQFTFMPEKKK